MKFFIIFFLILLRLWLPSTVEAKWWWQKEIKDQQGEIQKEIKEEIKEELRDLKGFTGTPSSPLKLNLRQQIWERLKEELPFLLPAGVNRAEITSIKGTTPPTEIDIIKDNKTITLKITEKTLILRKFGGKSSLTELHVGDIVSARGEWQDSSRAVLDTRVLRDLSIQKRPATFWGKIKSVNLSDKSFVLETVIRGDQKVLVGEETKIVNRREQEISLADLVVGHRVRVTGLWDANLRQIDQVRMIKDWSIGPKTTPSPLP